MSDAISARESYACDRRRAWIEIRGGRAVAGGTSEERGEAVRVIAGGRLGAATRVGARSEKATEELLERARLAAECGDAPGFLFPAPADPSTAPRTFESVTETLSPGDLAALGRSAAERVRDAVPGASVDLDLRAEARRATLDNTSGIAHEERSTTFLATLTATLAGGDERVEVRAEAGSRGPAGVLDAVVAAAIEQLRAAQREAPARQPWTRVLLAPEAVAVLMAPLVLGLDGLEAALGGSPCGFALGRELLDARVSLVDDGLLVSGLASSRVDGEGVPRRTQALVERGVLAGFYHDLRSAAVAGAESTGNARRTGLLPERAPGNWELKIAGSLARDALLREAGDALLVFRLAGGGPAARDGSFSAATALALAVSGGEIVGRVPSVVLSGNVYQALRDGLVAAGGDARWSYHLGSPLLAPTLLLETLDIGG